MDDQILDIDLLIKLAQDDPDGLEQLRNDLCRRLIENAPKQYQRRLKGIQFQVNMARQKSNNGLHSCIKISEMMMESYQKLQTALNDLSTQDMNDFTDLNHTPHNENTLSADIINFRQAFEKA